MFMVIWTSGFCTVFCFFAGGWSNILTLGGKYFVVLLSAFKTLWVSGCLFVAHRLLTMCLAHKVISLWDISRCPPAEIPDAGSTQQYVHMPPFKQAWHHKCLCKSRKHRYCVLRSSPKGSTGMSSARGHFFLFLPFPLPHAFCMRSGFFWQKVSTSLYAKGEY